MNIQLPVYDFAGPDITLQASVGLNALSQGATFGKAMNDMKIALNH